MATTTVSTETLAGDVLCVAVGNISHDDALEALEAAIYEALQRNVARMVFNLKTCDYVESKGWGTFIWASEQCRALGGAAAMCNANIEVKSIFELGGFDELITMAPDVEAARQAVLKDASG